MEVLTPAQPEPVVETPQRTDVPKDLIDAGVTLKNIEILDHLGLRGEMFNRNVMEKIEFIASKVDDIRMLQDIDMRIGDDGSMPKIDRIYSYLKLRDQADRIREEGRLITERMNQYERR